MGAYKTKCIFYSFMILAGGAMGIAAFFMVWESYGILSLTGYEITREFTTYGAAYINWMPLIALMAAVSITIAGLVAVLRPNRGIGWGVVISGIIVAAAAIIFYLYTDGAFHMSNYVGTGVYLALTAGMLVVLFGILRLTAKEKCCSP